jgi:hypothetical protein
MNRLPTLFDLGTGGNQRNRDRLRQLRAGIPLNSKIQEFSAGNIRFLWGRHRVNALHLLKYEN